MALKLMYITNRPDVAQIAESVGVDRIFVDMEYVGKAARQGGMDTVQSHHTVQDIKNVKRAVVNSEIMVRCNPIHENSKNEIDAVVEAGADLVMLPYFKTADEVKVFLEYVGGRVKTMLLLETPEAAACIDEILKLDGIDEMFIGLNDLSLGYGKKFMFELLSDGTVERLCFKFKEKHVPYGFGGIAALGKGMLPSERIIKEHYRLGSTCAILSRSFCDANKIADVNEIRSVFVNGVREIRALEAECALHMSYFTDNKEKVKEIVSTITAKI
ncbi:MAG: aldolase [Clostridia bacterium]|nr:aldolase [Clostridia bacterium]